MTEGLTRLIAAALFLALPVTVGAVRQTDTPAVATVATLDPISDYRGEAGTGFGNNATCNGLDGALACFMQDGLGPFHILANWFSFAVGMIFIMIGISRLMKSAQEGAKGPLGTGTLMTFFVGGMLISYDAFIRIFTMTFFNDPTTRTYANLEYTEGLTDEETGHIYLVLNAVLRFLILVGIVSVLRGCFICRNVAEGSGNASLMSGITHLVGGALAVNLGPVLNAVQTTLGITGYGITFS